MYQENAFLDYVSKQLHDLQELSLSILAKKVGGINNVYLVMVDVLKGFCEQGPLSSSRVNQIVGPVSELAGMLRQKGLPPSNFIFLNDAHTEDAVEFRVFPPHCVRGTKEAEVVEGLLVEEQMQVFYKNATNGLFGENQKGEYFYIWLERVLERKSAFIVVGDCTDLCIYQNAMGIRLLANQRDALTHVVVPKSHVETYDLCIEDAIKVEALAHDADLMNLIFLYHMKLNGIEVVRSVIA